jgi:cell division protein ZapB
MKNDASQNIQQLESKVEELLELSQRLAKENADIKAQLQKLQEDRSSLVEQKEQVRAQVENMIARLKAMEPTV